jgi:hypothetical protein
MGEKSFGDYEMSNVSDEGVKTLKKRIKKVLEKDELE